MDQLVNNTVMQAITLAIALLGAALGLINTWHALDKSRVKLIVKPAHMIPYGGVSPSIQFGISVTNLSAFAVTVDDVGFLFHGDTSRASITIQPLLIDGKEWPRRLEPRTTVTLYCSRPDIPDRRIRCAYAKTTCGVTQTGNSAALKQVARGA